MFEPIKNAFNHIVPFDEHEWAMVKGAFEVLEIPPKQVLTNIGEPETQVYFVVKGILRLYCINRKEEEITVYLFKEHHFASCYLSFLTQAPSDQALESLENCTLLAMSRASFDQLHHEVPKMNIITRVIAEQRFINAQRIFSSHIMHTPEERYVEFERLHGDLLLRVPHHIIASFLGITPVSLSRIRKRVSRK